MNFPKRLLLKKQGANTDSVPYFYLSQKQPSSLMQDRYQNWSCVLDPAIALSHYGVAIADKMSKEIELWVVRELWNIINNAEFYSHRTELITPKTINTRQGVAEEVIWSLKEWEKTKQEKDLARLGVYWLGDNLQESFLPHSKPVEFFKRWEALAKALDKRNKLIPNDESEILTSAFRDTIALTASLESAFILTYQLPTEFDKGDSPPICEMLKTWGISCQAINKRNPIAAMEREYILQLIVRSGLGKFLLAGVHLAAFHLVIPATSSADTEQNNSQTANRNSSNNFTQESYFWNKIKGVWYYL